MKCSSCSKTIEEDSKFCEHCGEKVEKKSEQNNSIKETKVTELSEKFIDHLEFLGFQVSALSSENSVDSFLATHPDKPNLFVKNISDFGLSVVTFYNMNEKKIIKSKSSFLSILNTVNSNSLLATYSCSTDNKLVVSSWFPAHYDKKEFSRFIDAFEKDIKRQLSTPGFMDYA